ncbi:hypothetical protein D3C80_1137270 [compost metagenome]
MVRESPLSCGNGGKVKNSQAADRESNRSGQPIPLRSDSQRNRCGISSGNGVLVLRDLTPYSLPPLRTVGKVCDGGKYRCQKCRSLAQRSEAA